MVFREEQSEGKKKLKKKFSSFSTSLVVIERKERKKKHHWPNFVSLSSLALLSLHSMPPLPRTQATSIRPRHVGNVPNAAAPRARGPASESHLPPPPLLKLAARRRPALTATARTPPRPRPSTAVASTSAPASDAADSSESAGDRDSSPPPSSSSSSPSPPPPPPPPEAKKDFSSRPPWRLGSYLSPPLALLAAALEGAWHSSLASSGLELVELDPGVRYRDSVEAAAAEEKAKKEGGKEEEEEEEETEEEPQFDFQGVEDLRSAVEAIRKQETARLAKQEKTRLVVENRVYSSRAFRKIHLELALRGDGLQVLHCVLFPRLDFDLPILSMDLVAAPRKETAAAAAGPEEEEEDGTSSSSYSSSDPTPPTSAISLAIIDPCPARLDGSLPDPYRDVVSALQKECGVASNRAQPEWGKEIFSEACILTRPAGDEELLKRFLRYALSLHAAHLTFSENLVSNLAESRRGKSRQQRLQERAATAAAHARYRDKQLQNGATRGVLAAAFGKEWADSYMETVMFDVEEF